MMKKIKLTQGKFALVSNIDFTYLNQWKWFAIKHHGNWYAVRHMSGGTRKLIRMHRLILERMGFIGPNTDHHNGDGLNNQRRNLRPATHSQNNYNQKLHKKTRSGYKGVSWKKENQKWQGQIMFNRRNIHLGYFRFKIEAARAYNKAAEKYFGEFACLNKI
jgi:hypothetical protein